MTIIKNAVTKDKLKLTREGFQGLMQILNVEEEDDGYIDPDLILDKQVLLKDKFGDVTNNLLTMARDAKKEQIHLLYF